MRHHLAGEQPHRLLGFGAADHAEIHLQRRRFEATDLTVIGLDRTTDIVGRADQAALFSTWLSKVSSEIDWIIFW
jgi:hypothetical protein